MPKGKDRYLPIELNEERPIFERQSHESATQYEYFRAYCDMGVGRSLEKVGEKHGISSSTLEQYSARWSWQKRLQAWLDYETEEKAKRRNEEIESMENRHAGIAMGMMAPGAKRIAELMKEEKWKDLDVIDAVRLIVNGVKIERLSRGKPTDIKQTNNTDDPSSKRNLEIAKKLAASKYRDEIEEKVLDALEESAPETDE